MGKAKTPKHPSLSDLSQRVMQLAELLSGGSHRGFARLVGCSQAVVSKIAAGKQEPGPNVIARIEHVPQVNVDWLRTGKGRPLNALTTDSISSVPLAEALLPGFPADHPEMLSSQRIDVPSVSFRDSVYAVHGDQCLPVVNSREKQIGPGDTVFVDADPKRWCGNIQSLDGKLCVLALDGAVPAVVAMCRVEVVYDRERSEWLVKTTWDGKPMKLLSVSAIASPKGRKHREIDLNDSESVADGNWSICGKAIYLQRTL